MGDNIDTLPTNNDQITEHEKKIIEYLFQTKIFETSNNIPQPIRYKLIIFSGICFIILSMKATDEFIYSLCGSKSMAVAIKVFIFLSLMLIIEKFL